MICRGERRFATGPMLRMPTTTASPTAANCCPRDGSASAAARSARATSRRGSTRRSDESSKQARTGTIVR